MIKQLGLAVLTAYIPTTLAMAADSQSTSINLSAVAKPVCFMPAATGSSGNNSNFDGSNITITQLLDDLTARVKPSETTITYPQVLCNWAATVTLTSQYGKMVRTVGTDTVLNGSGAFAQNIDYKVELNWGDVVIHFDTVTLQSEKKLSRMTNGANVADMIVRVIIPEGNVPVLAGTYSDVLTVKVGAAL